MDDCSLTTTASYAPQETSAAAAPPALGLVARLARQAVLGRLRGLRRGRIEIVGQGQAIAVGDPEAALQVRVTVHQPAFWIAIATQGTVGGGEAYMRGAWSCSDLTALVRILVLNRALLDGLEGGWARLSRPFLALFHALHRNTRRGSRANISAHYDLGNAFFALFLDTRMMYSSAYFPHPGASLEEASEAKLARICERLELRSSDHLLEIGTGWGGLAIYAAQRHGCRVTTTTIARAQHAVASERVRAAGLADRVTVLLSDYRDLTGTYDKLVSVEMIEAVGAAYLGTFFACCARLLAPTGSMLLQAITIADQQYAAACRSVDFIQRHIFPGSCIPSVTALATAATAASDLRICALDDITPHYARTLRLWRERFLERSDEVAALGYDAVFRRMWEFYLCYCEGGFSERAISALQILFTRPEYRQREEHLLNRAALAIAR